jgi:hypothetical protein
MMSAWKNLRLVVLIIARLVVITARAAVLIPITLLGVLAGMYIGFRDRAKGK